MLSDDDLNRIEAETVADMGCSFCGIHGSERLALVAEVREARAKAGGFDVTVDEQPYDGQYLSVGSAATGRIVTVTRRDPPSPTPLDTGRWVLADTNGSGWVQWETHAEGGEILATLSRQPGGPWRFDGPLSPADVEHGAAIVRANGDKT